MTNLMTCPGCGKVVPAAEGRYSERGDLVCRACLAQSQIAHQADVVDANIKAAKHGDIIYGSTGALVLALLSLFVQHRLITFLFPLAAFVGAVLSIVIAARFKEVRHALGWKLIPHFMMATVALLISTRGLTAAWRGFDDRQQEIHRDIVFEDDGVSPSALRTVSRDRPKRSRPKSHRPVPATPP